MKKKIFIGIAIFSAAFIMVINLNLTNNNSSKSTLKMENLLALNEASAEDLGEGGDGGGPGRVYSGYTSAALCTSWWDFDCSLKRLVVNGKCWDLQVTGWSGYAYCTYN